jgi:imidazolonepropionase-like amidohydrolase
MVPGNPYNNVNNPMKQVLRPLLLCIAIFATQVASAPAAPPGLVAIHNARVVTVSGPTLPRATVLIRDGLIEAVGESVTPPAGAWVVEGEGLTVYPGLISALSTWGIPQAAPAAGAAGPAGRGAAAPATTQAPQQPPARGPEDRPQTTSWLRAADEVRTTDSRLEGARAVGFTTSVTFPTRGLIAGHGAVVNLAAETARDMVIAPSVGLYLSTATSGGFRSFPGSLMGVIAYIRQVWIDAAYYEMVKADYDKSPAAKKRPQYDRALEGVLDAHQHVLLPANRAAEMDRMIGFSQELKMKPVFYGGHEAYKAADMLKKAGVPILVNATWPERSKEADPEVDEPLQVLDLRENAPSSPAALAKAGVPFAFYAGDTTQPKDFVKNIKKAIDAGLTPEQAVRAMTLSAAEIFGVNDRLGSIEKGKIANLLVTKGDLFQESTKVQFVMIDGRKYEPAPEAAPAKPEGGSAQ